MIIVMGLPGAGKSTVLVVAKENGWEVLNYGTMMMDIASSEHGVKGRDDIRKLPSSVQRQIQQKVAEKLAMQKKREVILDTHCSINTPSGYLPGLPFDLLKPLSVERIVLVTAPIDDILARRQKDKSRVRDTQSRDSLAEHDSINRAYLACYSTITGSPALVIQNRDGKLEEAKAKFASLLQ